MKILKNLVSFLFFTSTAQAQSFSSGKLLAEKIIQTFQVNQIDEFQKLLLNEKDFSQIVIPEMMKDTIHGPYPQLIEDGLNFYKNQKHILLFKKIFNDILLEGKELGIANWKDIKFEFLEPEPKVQENNTQPTHIATGIVFSYAGNKYVLYSIEMRKIVSSYKLVMIHGIARYK